MSNLGDGPEGVPYVSANLEGHQSIYMVMYKFWWWAEDETKVRRGPSPKLDITILLPPGHRPHSFSVKSMIPSWPITTARTVHLPSLSLTRGLVVVTDPRTGFRSNRIPALFFSHNSSTSSRPTLGRAGRGRLQHCCRSHPDSAQAHVRDAQALEAVSGLTPHRVAPPSPSAVHRRHYRRLGAANGGRTLRPRASLRRRCPHTRTLVQTDVMD